MITNLDKANEQYESYKDMITLFKNENAVLAASMLEGMSKQIEDSLRKESIGRTLDSLKVEFY